MAAWSNFLARLRRTSEFYVESLSDIATVPIFNSKISEFGKDSSVFSDLFVWQKTFALHKYGIISN